MDGHGGTAYTPCLAQRCHTNLLCLYVAVNRWNRLIESVWRAKLAGLATLESPCSMSCSGHANFTSVSGIQAGEPWSLSIISSRASGREPSFKTMASRCCRRRRRSSAECSRTLLAWCTSVGSQTISSSISIRRSGNSRILRLAMSLSTKPPASKARKPCFEIRIRLMISAILLFFTSM